jgi:hypothetical protein
MCQIFNKCYKIIFYTPCRIELALIVLCIDASLPLFFFFFILLKIIDAYIYIYIYIYIYLPKGREIYINISLPKGRELSNKSYIDIGSLLLMFSHGLWQTNGVIII